ncbi:toxic anion resistance protein [Rhizobium sp. P40RR-XXII]|uniref:toxic anion resistance protein n=1 Tax=unclassified Rhizobium TaxID=2613769 RepID=UPI0014570BC8|nr:MULTISPECIES: toxic anion resistance protein [unclassified Rhizobium]NLR83646.1 toxic anion resistance protein [Rhizobium sp. P28RR-XV]NLS16066.1 toxic anion resistance protein [Rhizobium sp. P40RR-XXII]
MSNTDISAGSTNSLPAVAADPAEIARIGDGIDLTDRAGISVYGDRAQQAVSDYSDRILREVRNRDLGEVGKLLTDIIVKSKKLDPASLKDEGFLSRMFSSFRARLERFKEQFEDVAGQIDRIGLELDRHKDILRRDIALLDDLHEETKQSIVQLDAYVQAGKDFAERFRSTELPRLKNVADAASANPGGGMLEAQIYQDSLQALDRLEKRVFYLQQARQLGIQQLPQIRIVQSGDETLIENLQATSALTVPAWKQKMVILLGLTQQKSALDLQKTVTDATNDMIRQASKMMKDQAIAIEQQSQRGIVDIDTLAAANRDLIDTISGVLKVQEDGRAKRAEAEQRMQKMTIELKKAMIEAR